MNLPLELPYYSVKYETVKSKENYAQFINWIKGEFDLFLMEEQEGLKVYFPNGWFSITVSPEKNCTVNIIIQIKSKTWNSGTKIESQIKHLDSHLNQILKTYST